MTSTPSPRECTMCKRPGVFTGDPTGIGWTICPECDAKWDAECQRLAAHRSTPSPRSLSAEMREAGLERWADRVALLELRLSRSNELGGTTADVAAARQETIYERDAVIERLRAEIAALRTRKEP